MARAPPRAPPTLVAKEQALCEVVTRLAAGKRFGPATTKKIMNKVSGVPAPREKAGAREPERVAGGSSWAAHLLWVQLSCDDGVLTGPHRFRALEPPRNQAQARDMGAAGCPRAMEARLGGSCPPPATGN
jgi:hypothetical protein